MQKIHKHGHDGNRYFWNIKTDMTEGEYRSRCATAEGVRSVLKSYGHNVKSITPVKAN
jgi:hypothetical protein